MTSTLRTITSGTLEWRGILVYISLERQRYVDHLQIETLEPARAPLPLTETGYLSRFMAKDTIRDGIDPAEYVETMLNQAAMSKNWGHFEMQIRQYALL